MSRSSTASHRMMPATRWAPEDPAYRITDALWTSPATTDCHLATTPDGDVVINTGFAYAGTRHRERYEEALGRPLDVRKIVYTQAYFEQIGGWSAFTGPGVETIAPRTAQRGPQLGGRSLRAQWIPRSQAAAEPP